MYSSTESRLEGARFYSELGKMQEEAGCPATTPRACRDTGLALGVSPSTACRRVYTRLQVQEVRGPGWPRDQHAARRARDYQRRYTETHSALEEFKQAWARHLQQQQQRREVLLLGLEVKGVSVRSCAACLELAFGADSLSKSTVAMRVKEAAQTARELFIV